MNHHQKRKSGATKKKKKIDFLPKLTRKIFSRLSSEFDLPRI